MRFPRMTTRRWLIAVALTGILFGILIERRSRFARLAQGHREKTRGVVIVILPESQIRYQFQPGDGGKSKPLTEREIAEYLHHDLLAKKYLTATTEFWLPVEADPPPP